MAPRNGAPRRTLREIVRDLRFAQTYTAGPYTLAAIANSAKPALRLPEVISLPHQKEPAS